MKEVADGAEEDAMMTEGRKGDGPDRTFVIEDKVEKGRWKLLEMDGERMVGKGVSECRVSLEQ